MRQFILCLFVVSLISFPVFAAKKKTDTPADKVETLAETNPDAIPVLQKIKGDKKDLTYDYIGSRYGFDAWLLSGPNVMQIVYTSKNKEGAMLGGALVGPDGKETSSELTKNFMKQYPERAQEILATVRKQLPVNKDDKKAGSPSEILWQKLQQGGQITFGPGKDVPEIFAILDPVAPATKEIWQHLSPLAKDNKITLHILPLGMTTADSIMEIAQTLGDKDPKAAWENLMNGKSNVKQDTPESAGILGMKANVDLAQGMNLRTLPFIAYHDGSGKIRIIQGVPKNWDDFTKQLTAK
jgi:hypothetical protein